MTRNRTVDGLRNRVTGRRHGRALLTTLTVTAVVAATALTGPAASAAPATSAPRFAPTAVSAARPAVAAGRLSPRGCAAVSTVVSCDLYAMTGTTTMLGTSVPIWGFSTTEVAGTASAPGPVLVVNQNDQVSITVHNGLSGENLSLALPGQAPTAISGTAGDDTSGVGTGSARTYSFKADRAGTFLYEAGHTPNGARQVAMGLAGAIVVLPSDGSAYGAVPGFPATTYDDDAVMVMSEIDPAFNANPSGFDMRNFSPKYRMFNGKPFPAADPVSTDQGHTVLLRYVNVGSQTHAMSVLGGDQVEIAQDGHQMKYQATVTAESVEPGQTLDTLVKMPTGPEAKLAVYEPAMHLDNNGQRTADPLQLAFGGMLTFLDTAAPPPSADGVGPVSTHLTLSPNPSDGLAPVTVRADLSDATTGASTVSQAEFVIDDAVTTGAGFGTPMTATFGTVDVVGATGTISTAVLDALDAGKHTVFVRALDSAGNWGVVGSAILNLPKTGPQTTNGSLVNSPANGATDVALSATGDDSNAGGNITDAEYFIDTVGGNTTGIHIAPNRASTVVSEDATILAATVHALGEGIHHVYVHSKDSLGLWGPPLDIPLVVDLTGPAVDAASVGPNPSNGILTNKSNPGYLYISAHLADKDAGGADQSNLVDAEALLDSTTTPVGSGIHLIAVDGKLDSPGEAVYGLIPISQIKSLGNGNHTVWVRGQDAAGNWGELFAVLLVVDKIAPVLGTLVGTPTPTNGAANLTLTAPVTEAVGLATAEFWVGATDPGVGKGIAIPVSIVGTTVVVTVPLAGIALGAQRFNLRVQDTAGNWSAGVNTTVTVSKPIPIKPNAIFNGLFEGTTPAWSVATGAVSTSASAKLNSTVEPASTKGLLAAVGTGNANNRRSFVTDNSPTAETGYHASFQFNANSLASGTANNSVLTIFDGQSTGGAAVFSVQFHRTGGANPINQIRAVMNRSGAGTNTGTWVTLPAGAHSVQVDWLAGPAAGANPGSLALKIDGTAAGGNSWTGNTSSLTVETVRLGVTAGLVTGTNPSSGSAFFDGFTSTRFTL